MKAFEFRLQTKLDITGRQEDIARVEVAEKQKAYQCALDKLESLIQYMEDLHRMLRQKNRSSLSVQEVIAVKEYQGVLKERISDQKKVVKQAESELEEAQQVLLEIMKERKTLDRLREREYFEYLCEVMRQEQNQIDEVAIAQYIRKHGKGEQHA